MSAITSGRLRALRAALVQAGTPDATRTAADALLDALSKAPLPVIVWSRLHDLGRYDETQRVLIDQALRDALRRRIAAGQQAPRGLVRRAVVRAGRRWARSGR